MKIKIDNIINFDVENLLETINNLDATILPNSYVVFLRNKVLLNRNIKKILNIDLPDNWAVLQLNECLDFVSSKCEYVRQKKITNDYGFIIKKSELNLLKQLLKKTLLIESLNKIIDNKICYSFYQNLIWPEEKVDCIDYYNFYTNKNIFDFCCNNLKKNIETISIRHQLQSYSRYINVDTMLQIFDYKLGITPEIVNELITISMVNIEYNNIADYLTTYQTKEKNVNKMDYLDKSIINIFFDMFIYCQKPICVVIPSYNNILYYKKNLDSIFNQKYNNYRVIYADDKSVDGTFEAVTKYILDNNLNNKTNVYQQSTHNAQCCGRYMCYILIDDDEIVCNVDGDDWMYDRDDAHQYNGFRYIEQAYKDGYLSTYGCFYKSSGPQWMETTTTYPAKVVKNKEYRTYKFLCKHLRTGYAGLYKSIQINDLLDNNFKFLHMCTDISTQYSVLEMSGEKHINILKPTYIYNQDNSINYNNSWYNLEKENNNENKEYNCFVQNKVKNTKIYDTIETIYLDRWYNFNLFKEILNIIILDKNNNNLSGGLQNIINKIEHELKNIVKYSIIIVTSLSYIETKELSNTILYINSDDSITTNLNINKFLRYMLTTNIDKIMISDNLIFDNETAISFENNNYSIAITPNEISVEKSSGYYTRDKFVELIDTKINSGIKLFIRCFAQITYIIALYNVELQWLTDCIESLKNQTDQNFCIILNDDKTPNLNYIRSVSKYINLCKVQTFGDRLTLSQSKKNLGLAGNNRKMIGLSESHLIACLDPDDAVAPTTTASLKFAYNSNPDFVYSNFYYCDKDLKPMRVGFCKKLENNNLVINENCVSHIRSYNKNTYYKTLGYDSTYRSAEDKDIIFKFEEIGATFKFIPEPLYLYRYNADSLTKKGTTLFNNQKTLQYCKTAVMLSYNRRLLHNMKISNIDLNQLWKKYGMDSTSETVYERYFNEYFDKIYVINLQNNTVNYTNMMYKLNLVSNNNVLFARFKTASNISSLKNVYENVVNNDIYTTFEKRENRKCIKSIGEIGCLESHLWCLKDALNKKYNKILILEDDIYFDKHFLIKFYEYTSNIPNNWRYMLLGASQWSWWGNGPHMKKYHFPPTRASLGTFAVAVDSSIIPDLINDMSTYDGPSDLGGYSKTIIKLKKTESIHSTAHIIENRSDIDKCYVFYPNLISADTRQSHIRDCSTESDFLQRCKNMEWKIKHKNTLICLPKLVSNFETKLVNDYDEIYFSTLIQPKIYYLKVIDNLPYIIHLILSENLDNVIYIKGDIDNSNLRYYKSRIQQFTNIFFY